MQRITEVVKHLIIINVLMFVLTHMIWTDGYGMLAFYYPFMEGSPFMPVQIVSHMFMHGDITHLLFNMFGLYMFGSAVEATWGPKRFLFYYFFCGFGALAAQMVVMWTEGSGAVLGASGAVFGLLAAFGMLYPNQRIMLLFPPIPMKAKYFVIGYAAIELFSGFGKVNDGVAHFAHLGGAIFGVLLILYWRKFGTNL